MPEVSIIVPVYKAEVFLHKCITSIINQSFKDWECILVDDGSPDCSGIICDDYSSKDSRIRVIHKKNGGVSSARNVGIDNANGRWICFVDSDDYVSPDYLSVMLEQAIADDIFVMVSFDNNKSVGEGLVRGEQMIKKYFSSPLEQLSAPYCKLFNRDILIKSNIIFEQGIHMGEDALFTLKYLGQINAVAYKDYPDLYFYNRDSGGLSTKYYSFSSEYKCFILWKRYLEEFVSKNAPQMHLEQTVWESRLPNVLYRSILALYNFHSTQSCSQFCSIANTIDREFTTLYGKYNKNCKIFTDRIITYVISKRWFCMYYYLRKILE